MDDQKLARACLAALARRSPYGLVVRRDEVEQELASGSDVTIASDADVECVRITVREAQA